MRRNGCRILALLLALCLLAGCGKKEILRTTEPEPTETTIPGPTPVVAGSGNSAELDCQDSYVKPGDARTQVAWVGEESLDNGVLRVLYNLEIGSYRSSGEQPQPDYSEPLYAQSCPLADGLSWEHYFLERTLYSYHTCQALYHDSLQPQIIQSEYYRAIPELHEEFYDESLPAYPLTFRDKDRFDPNSMHQKFLDAIPEMLEQLAQEHGAANAAELAQKLAGPDAGAEDLQQAVHLLNYAYTYFTELSYYNRVTQEELDAYLNEHPGQYSDSEKTVTILHCLFRPEGAEVDADGKVIATQAQWDACLRNVEQLKRKRNGFLTKRNPSNTFMAMANEYSEDAGTKANGGRYVSVRRGQLNPQIEEWAFADERKYGDEQIILTDIGYEMVLFESSETLGTSQARADCQQEKYRNAVQELKATYPLKVDYSQISLTETAPELGLSDVLYADVAHERYPEMMVFLQRDFNDAPYGSWKVGPHGCGITTLAMVTTYLSDELHTPAELAARYSEFDGPQGTDRTIFIKMPPELGFLYERDCWEWEIVEEALREGKVAVSLQVKGYFTRGGHYLALVGLTDDGDVVIRDSNIRNYTRLEGHQVDHFDHELLLPNNVRFWIFQPKIRRIAACARCGNPDSCGMPEGLLLEDYICEKCAAALTRRNGFLALNQ